MHPDRESFAPEFYPAGPRPVVGARTDNKADGAYRFERNGWIYVHLEGAPDRSGYPHGYLLADEIRELLRVRGPFLEHTTKRDWNFYRNAAERILAIGVPATVSLCDVAINPY